MATFIRALIAWGSLAFVVVSPVFGAGGFGMTWGKLRHDSTSGTDLLKCLECNPYTGDTACTQFRPLLCYKSDGSPAPLDIKPHDFYHGWVHGHVALTPPIQGSTLTSLTVANQTCQQYFGAGYQMAEFHHEGGGWGWHAYGNISSSQRFWVYINDQPGNCWNP